ncbi:MAG TPA: phosphonate ABC transporter, permease protein PhnE [Mucilaginibacter sp.]|jgi:phosphonate transport system permease protein|nr:phosphonate ABC transporter, permease protein PhnE [Mucilaginibacter sp.]
MTTIDITLPSKKFKRKTTIFSITAIVVTVACIYIGFNPFAIFSEFHFMRDLLAEMFPPNYETLTENSSTGYAILQTLSMAFLGTVYGGIIAIILAFLAASNTMPYKPVRMVVQGIVSLVRVMPTLVVVLIFVIAVGPGAFAGMLTLVFTIIGTFGRLFVDVIENAENSPGEAIYSVGASRLQVLRYSIFPQILPSLIASLLYSFDVSMRSAISLGIFGGGGIGFKFQLAKSVLHYKDMTAYISIIIVLVIATEKVSDYFRRRILGEGKLS